MSPATVSPLQAAAADQPDPTPPTWRSSLAWGIGIYLLSRIIVIVGTAAAVTARAVDPRYPGRPRPESATKGILEGLASWDGRWYLEIVRKGYPRFVQDPVTYSFDDTRAARAAFFPLYPQLVNTMNRILPGGDTGAALFTSTLIGLVFVVLVGAFTQRRFGAAAARRAMILVSLFPGSFVLSFAYSECVLVVLALACIWALTEERWLLAGLAAALATTSRPNGIALIAACGVTSLIAIHRRRQWSSLIAPLLSPIGVLGFHLFLAHHTGEAGVWFRIQRQAWKEGYSFGWTAIEGLIDFAKAPLSSPTDSITVLTLAMMVGLIIVCTKIDLGVPMWTYSIAILVLMLIPDTVTARPRFLFTAFPLLIGLAVWWKPRWNDQWATMLAISASGLLTITCIYGAYGAIP